MRILGNQEVVGVIKAGRRVNEGFKSYSLSEDLQLTKSCEKYWKVATTLDDVKVKLPDASSLPNGFEVIITATTGNVTVTDFDGTSLQLLDPGSLYYIYLMNNTTSSGEWIISVDTSYDISVDTPENPSKGVRSYFKILSEYDGNVH